MNPILRVSNLKKSYYDDTGETIAVDGFNMNIMVGEFIAIVGPSGCGKSTILNILANLDNKTSGNIIFSTDNIQTSYMLQEDTLFPWLNILDNCLIGLKIKKQLTNDKKERVIQLIKNYGLKDFINSYPKSLSGGMRQRVALIRTLAANPDIILLDEPFSALDYQTRLSVSDDVYKIIKKEGKTTIMVTHDIAEAISMADRIIVLTKRPSKVKNVYTIKMANKSTPINNRKCKEFASYYERIWKELDIHE